ncbi:NCAM1 protein, partial [Polyodon spathula]|nr:NCAM1 protein [Polyodon spathula]
MASAATHINIRGGSGRMNCASLACTVASHITPDSQSDFGNYNCTATNRIGQESKEFILIQAEVPSSPLINEVSPYSSTARVEFEEPDSSGGVPVLKYKAEWRVVGASEWMRKEFDARDVYAENLITITGLRPDSRYELRMSAINGKGQGESSESTIFKTEPVRKCSSFHCGTGEMH